MIRNVIMGIRLDVLIVKLIQGILVMPILGICLDVIIRLFLFCLVCVAIVF